MLDLLLFWVLLVRNSGTTNQRRRGGGEARCSDVKSRNGNEIRSPTRLYLGHDQVHAANTTGMGDGMNFIFKISFTSGTPSASITCEIRSSDWLGCCAYNFVSLLQKSFAVSSTCSVRGLLCSYRAVYQTVYLLLPGIDRFRDAMARR